MWRSIPIALTALLAAPAAAQACDPLPAGFAEELTVRNGLHQGRTAEREPTLLCVKAGGRRIVLRRAQFEDPYEGRAHGTVIAAAAAAGRKVAWIETRLTRERRIVVVRVVRIGARGRVRPLRRIVAARDNSDRQGPADVVLTRRGDLAWIAPYFDFKVRVVHDPPRRRPRTVAITYADSLWIEDRTTLAWYGDRGYGFHDLRRPTPGVCPRRSAYHVVASNDTVVVTEGGYEERQVLRACVRATGRDPVIAQADGGFGNGDAVSAVGLDRHWVMLVQSTFTRYDPCAGGHTQRPVDARPGRRGRATRAPYCGGEPSLATSASQTAVTDRGIAAWTVGEGDGRRLLAAAPGGGVTELDRGAISGLRAQGTAVAWTRDLEPRSAELP